MKFPSPCGVWVVSTQICDRLNAVKVSVPLRGVGCFERTYRCKNGVVVSVPLRGVGCFRDGGLSYSGARVSVPLRGVGCFRITPARSSRATGFRPLAGCGLFPKTAIVRRRHHSFRPLAGCGLFPSAGVNKMLTGVVSVPLRGVGCFPTRPERYEDRAFPSPCGVWVVSEKYGYTESDSGFPSPCGVWVVSIGGCMTKLSILVSVPLRGVGCFQQNRSDEKWANGFRPLAGCGLFL